MSPFPPAFLLLACCLVACQLTDQAGNRPLNAGSIQHVLPLPRIAGKPLAEVEKILGTASHCETTKFGRKCNFQPGATEIVFIDNAADWITVNQFNGVKFSPEAIAALGYPVLPPSFGSNEVFRWTEQAGFKEAQIFAGEGDAIAYAYIKIRTPFIAKPFGAY